MGTQYSSDIQVRRITEGYTISFFLHIKGPIQILNMKLFVIAAVCLAATVSAEADADAWYGYGGYLHQQAWPGARGPGFEGTCYGCRVPTHHFIGKRSAEPYYGYGYPFAYGLHPYALRPLAGPLATAAGPTGIAGHGTGTSYVARSPQGLRGKRSAEPYYGYGFYGYPYGLRAYGPGIAGHPSGTSYVHRSPQGLGK